MKKSLKQIEMKFFVIHLVRIYIYIYRSLLFNNYLIYFSLGPVGSFLNSDNVTCSPYSINLKKKKIKFSLKKIALD